MLENRGIAYYDEQGNMVAYTEEYLAEIDAFREQVFQGRTPGDVEKPKQLEERLVDNIIAPPKGTVTNASYQAPLNINKDDYMYHVHRHNMTYRYRHFQSISSERIFVRDYQDHLDLFHPYFIDVWGYFLRRYPTQKLHIVKGFTPPDGAAINPHNIGMAVDILAKTENELYALMDAAWLSGFPNIYHIGNFSDEMLVHIDICPRDEAKLYDGIYYEGPWSVSRAIPQ